MTKCEKCGKIHDGSFGSGRFCSRSCANSRKHSKETKEKISDSMKEYNNQHTFICKFCGFNAKTIRGLANHVNHCKLNPNRVIHHNKNSNKKVKLRNKITLDITYKELEEYRETHTVCEICGRSVQEATKYTGKYASKNLCIDHDHNTNKFRGLLCQVCNRQLGWYENNKDKINEYLNK